MSLRRGGRTRNQIARIPINTPQRSDHLPRNHKPPSATWTMLVRNEISCRRVLTCCVSQMTSLEKKARCPTVPRRALLPVHERLPVRVPRRQPVQPPKPRTNLGRNGSQSPSPDGVWSPARQPPSDNDERHLLTVCNQSAFLHVLNHPQDRVYGCEFTPGEVSRQLADRQRAFCPENPQDGVLPVGNRQRLSSCHVTHLSTNQQVRIIT